MSCKIERKRKAALARFDRFCVVNLYKHGKLVALRFFAWLEMLMYKNASVLPKEQVEINSFEEQTHVNTTSANAGHAVLRNASDSPKTRRRNGQTDGQTDRPSFKDVSQRLKRIEDRILALYMERFMRGGFLRMRLDHNDHFDFVLKRFHLFKFSNRSFSVLYNLILVVTFISKHLGMLKRRLKRTMKSIARIVRRVEHQTTA